MPGVTHPFVSAVADGADATLVRPSNWNAGHVMLDNTVFGVGTDNDGVFYLRSTVLAADEEITSVIVGTSDHPGAAANSLIISNITADGDILVLAQTGGNSTAYWWVDASAPSSSFYVAGVRYIYLAASSVTFDVLTIAPTSVIGAGAGAVLGSSISRQRTGTDQNFNVVAPIALATGLTFNMTNDAANANVPLELRASQVHLSVGPLTLQNDIGSLGSTADQVRLGSYDLSAGNATLALSTETAVVTETVTSDRTLSVRINGTTYKICLKS